MKEELFVELLEDIGLTHNQSLIYFTLIKAGKKGSIVRELDHVTDIKRTNIYPILRELIDFGCVLEGGYAEKSKNATIYIAVEPNELITHLIQKKKDEIQTLKKFKEANSRVLQEVFEKGMEISLEEIDPIMRQYVAPLIKFGWKLNSYVQRKEMPMFDYEVHDCMLHAPNAKILKDCSFHLFIFGYDIQHDKGALEFFSQSLKRKTREMKSYFFDIKQIQLIDEQVELFENKYPCFKMEIKSSDLKNSRYFSEIAEDLKDEFNNQDDDYLEIGKAIILHFENKLFYLWAESNQILKEMIKPILEVEGS